jgi:hypothetical protein
MWVQPLSAWFLAAAMVSQVGNSPVPPPAGMPELIVFRQATFAIPFRVLPSDDPRWQPVEVQLYVSIDRGAHWRLYSRAPKTQNHFTFRASGDGEYWFAIRTADRSGQVRPATITAPGLRVLVDARSPALKQPTQPGDDGQAPAKGAAPSSSDQNQNGPPPTPPPSDPQRSTESTGDAGPALTPESKGSVGVTANPAIGRQYATDASSKGNPALPVPPPPERPRMVNSRTFELEYDVDSVGPSGLGRVELWGTRDGGKTWQSFGIDGDRRSPMQLSVKEEGTYGFRVVVSNGVGLGGTPPVPGDLPDLTIGVDFTKPTSRIVSAKQGTDSEAGQLVISWQADDLMLAARPVSLSFSENRGGPWLPIAAGLENTGRYAWPLDNRTPAKVFLRLEVRDEAGNVGTDEMAEPLTIDQSHPTVRIRSVRPLNSAGPAISRQP